MRRVTQQDLARHAGLSQTTVSMALRGHPSIAATTRALVQRVAQEIGYVPDPMLSSLVAYRHQSKQPAFKGTLGLVHKLWTREELHRPQSGLGALYQGACNRAAELGYQVEDFWLNETGMTAARLQRVLDARNIKGLFVLGSHRAASHLRLDWSRYTPVRVGDCGVPGPEMHLVAPDYFRAMELTLREMRRRGYRRLGFVTCRSFDRRYGCQLSAAFGAERMRVWLNDAPPPLACDNRGQPMRESVFWQWFKDESPDALVVAGDWLAAQCITWLQARGLNVPADIGLAAIPRPAVGLGRQVAGIDDDLARVGATAVDLVAGLLVKGERGLPERPARHLLMGRWVQGDTLLKKVPSQPSAAPHADPNDDEADVEAFSARVS